MKTYQRSSAYVTEKKWSACCSLSECVTTECRWSWSLKLLFFYNPYHLQQTSYTRLTTDCHQISRDIKKKHRIRQCLYTQIRKLNLKIFALIYAQMSFEMKTDYACKAHVCCPLFNRIWKHCKETFYAVQWDVKIQINKTTADLFHWMLLTICGDDMKKPRVQLEAGMTEFLLWCKMK